MFLVSKFNRLEFFTLIETLIIYYSSNVQLTSINIGSRRLFLLLLVCVVVNCTIAVNGILEPRHLFKEPSRSQLTIRSYNVDRLSSPFCSVLTSSRGQGMRLLTRLPLTREPEDIVPLRGTIAKRCCKCVCRTT